MSNSAEPEALNRTSSIDAFVKRDKVLQLDAKHCLNMMFEVQFDCPRQVEARVKVR